MAANFFAEGVGVEIKFQHFFRVRLEEIFDFYFGSFVGWRVQHYQGGLSQSPTLGHLRLHLIKIMKYYF